MQNNPKNLPISDNHIHIDPINGVGLFKVTNLFYNAGGRNMFIPNLPSWQFNKPFDFKKAIDINIQTVEKINQETKLNAYALSGVHPAEFSQLIRNGKSFEDAYQLVKKGLEYAQKTILEGKAVAIGEIGRPHYPVSDEEWEYHNKLLKYSMELAKDTNSAIQLHTESATPKQFKEFADMADKIGFKKYKLIKHFSGPYTDTKENYGLTPSLTASKKTIKEGIKKSNYFLMETDYIDDPERPGAVLGPKTVPKRTLNFLDNEIFTEETIYKIHKENIEKVYDINIS